MKCKNCGHKKLDHSRLKPHKCLIGRIKDGCKCEEFVEESNGGKK